MKKLKKAQSGTNLKKAPTVKQDTILSAVPKVPPTRMPTPKKK